MCRKFQGVVIDLFDEGIQQIHIDIRLMWFASAIYVLLHFVDVLNIIYQSLNTLIQTVVQKCQD